MVREVEPSKGVRRTFYLAPRLTTVAQLDALLYSLEALRAQLNEAEAIEFTIAPSSDL